MTLIELLAQDLLGSMGSGADGERRSVLLWLDPACEFRRLISHLAPTFLRSQTELFSYVPGDGGLSQLALKLALLRLQPDERAIVLTDAEAAAADGGAKHWFRVGEVLEFGSPAQVNRYLVHHQLGNSEVAGEMLFNLHDAITKSRAINYYLEKDQDFDKVLNVFIRVNSGGTPLSYSDLLLSVATAQWNSLDARETINELSDELNRQGRFRFEKDFVLKACLVLIDLPDVRFRVANFKVDNTRKIEERWPEISAALRLTVDLASSYGFTGQTLTSAYALIPIAYFLLRKSLPPNFVESSAYASERAAIKKWLVSAMLAGAFGGQPDTVLNAARSTIGDGSGGFPGEVLAARFAQLNRPLNLTAEQIDGLLDTKYGEGRAFGVLATLYPTLDYANLFHQDHLFPRSLFTRARLRGLGVPEDDLDFCLENVARLPNLQLLAGTPNQEKSSKPPEQWINERYPTTQERRACEEVNLIPSGIPPVFPNFREFFTARRKPMEDRLSVALGRELGTQAILASSTG